MTSVRTLNIINSRTAMLLLSTLTLIGLISIPLTAQARGGIHVDVPSLSIDIFSDRSNTRRKNKVYRNRYSYDQYKSRGYYQNKRRSYQRNYYHNNNRYNRNNYNNRQYNSRYGGSKNYYGGSKNYYGDRNAQVCPSSGYSPYYNDNLECYRHEDHFHCS